MYFKKIFFAIALIGLVFAAYFAYFVYNTMFVPNTAFQNEEAYIFIRTDATYNDVRKDLIPILEDISSFDALAKQKKYINNVRAGKYRIEKGMNNNEIINSIRSKNIPVKVSFNNQRSIEALAGRIANQIEADSTSLIHAMTSQDFLTKNAFNKQNVLGMYLPNSYEFFWNTNAKKFRDRMLKEYTKFWNESKLQKARQVGLTPDEVMTLASIVHEESKQKSEQPRIAGVYINRLKNKWPLQADPTLKFAAYQLPEYKNTIIKRILNKHKEIDSPYNTYKNQGLPPGLITMPDLSAINAVLNYEKHDYFYFAASVKRLGFHEFSKTLAQHNRNAKAYQKFLSQQGISK